MPGHAGLCRDARRGHGSCCCGCEAAHACRRDIRRAPAIVDIDAGNTASQGLTNGRPSRVHSRPRSVRIPGRSTGCHPMLPRSHNVRRVWSDMARRSRLRRRSHAPKPTTSTSIAAAPSTCRMRWRSSDMHWSFRRLRSTGLAGDRVATPPRLLLVGGAVLRRILRRHV